MELMENTLEERECANCGDEVLFLSSRDWCDGCEEELEGCNCRPLGGQHQTGCPLQRPIIPTHPHPISGH